LANAPQKTIKDVVTDFLGSAPSLNEISGYRLPPELQERAHTLLEKNRAASVSDDERSEMEEFRQIDHLLTLVKAKAKLKPKAPSQRSAITGSLHKRGRIGLISKTCPYPAESFTAMRYRALISSLPLIDTPKSLSNPSCKP